MSEIEVNKPANAAAFDGLAFDVLNDIPSSARQDTYFHYTSAAGLKGIIELNTLHYSDTKYLNDDSEGKWGAHVLKSYINDVAPTSSDRVKAFLNSVFEKDQGFSESFRSIVFCMSKQGNLLNQWRDYGKDVVPYCIEFDRAFLMEKHDAKFETYLRPIIYDEGQQKSAIVELMSRLFKVMLPLWETLSDEELDEMALYASFQVGHLLEHFKHPAFEAEQEVRLRISHYQLMSDGVKPKFKSNSLGLVPYYEWSPGLKLKIRTVQVGPSPHADASVEALREFLKENEIDAKASTSNIPLRR